MCNFTAFDLASTAMAFAATGHPDAQLFLVLARAAEGCMCDFNSQELTDAACAFATMGELLLLVLLIGQHCVNVSTWIQHFACLKDCQCDKSYHLHKRRGGVDAECL